MTTPRTAPDMQDPRLTEVEFDPFAAATLQKVVPTTEAQREVWLASELSDEASLAYNESASFRLHGVLNAGALQRALQDLVDRHEALRSTVSADGLELCIAAQAILTLATVDLRTLDAKAREQAVAAHLAREVETPFDLTKGPLVRAWLLQLADAEHLLVFCAHHIICDGWSLGVIESDLAASYEARLGGKAPQLAPADSYADYATEDLKAPSTREFQEDEKYWLARFDASVPVLDLPADRPRPPRRSFGSRREDVHFDAALIDALKRSAGKHGASLFGVLLAGFAALLSRMTGQTDVVVGVPAAGQSASGNLQLVGHCVNLLPVRTAVASEQSAAELLTTTQADLLDAFEHQRYTFGTLLKRLRIERDPSRLPLVNVMFNLDQSSRDDALGIPGLQVRSHTNPRHFENFELFVNLCQEDGGLRLECQYNTGLFDAQTVREWMRCYETLLRGLVEAPHTPVGRLPLMPASQVTTLTHWNATVGEFDRGMVVWSMVGRAGVRGADAVVLRSGGEAFSQAELAAQVHRLARALRARGVGRGSLVGLYLPRGVSMVVAQLAVLASGAAYVPLDPAYPAERLAFMVQDAQLALLLTDSTLLGTLSWPRERALLVDADAAQIDAHGDSPLVPDPQRDARPEDAAYVIYTSGSTGQPKGVVVPQRAVVNFLCSMARTPGLSASDRLVAVTTLSFDIAVLELLLPLAVGAEVVLASREQASDGHALRALLESCGATVMQATPSTWRLLIEAGWQGAAGFKALVGGEALPPDLAQQLSSRSGELWNMYGPTETTVWSTCARVTEPERGIVIGTPIANTTVWILDERGQPCPIGIPGEIHIGGDGVTLGYLSRPELTAERFIADPFSPTPGARLYRTGDRGRWRHDGQLEHLGRLDFQVKVRGYRIELGEIEAILASHPAIARCVVTTREDRAGDVRLVAYAVPCEGQRLPEAGALREHLRQRLPDYMLPQHFVSLPTLPLLPNGKINRKELPSPLTLAAEATGVSARREPPRTETERLVAAAMERLLSLPGLGSEDSFFALGGHSLLAAQLSNQLGRELDLHVPLRAVFDQPSVRALAQWIDLQRVRGGARQPTVPRRAEQASSPLSLMQQRVWFLEQLSPGRAVYNTPSGHRFFGRIDEPVFERAFAEMVRRQSALRTVVAVRDDGTPMQKLLPQVPVRLFPAEDLRHLPHAERDACVERRMAELAREPFELTVGPLFRTRMFRVDDEEHVLFFMIHHLVWDGWSFDIFYREMSALYPAFAAGAAPQIAELPVSYGDFAAWQRQWMSGAELATQVSHWKRLLDGGIEPLELPADKHRPPVQSGEGGSVWIDLPRPVAEAVRALGRRHGATPFMVLLALYAALLWRMTGRTDLIVGTPVRGRNLPELESVMGFFVNALPLRLKLDPAASIDTLIETVRDTALEAFKYPDVPFEHLVQELRVPRDESRFPIYQVSFSYQDGRGRPTQWGNLRHRPNFVRVTTIAEDLGLGFLEREDGLRGGFTYNSDIFSDATIRAMSDRFAGLVEAALANPARAVRDLTALRTQERVLLERWNVTRAEYDRAVSVWSVVGRAGVRGADAVVLRSGGEAFSQAELAAQVHRLARALRARGVGRGSLVGLYLPRGVSMVVAQLAVLASGAAYVPLDPAYPAERLAFMVQDAQLALLLTDSTLLGTLSWPRERALLVDADAAQIDAHGDSPLVPDPQRDARPEDAAYVIYTSGSTGQPKGVVVPQRAVVNFLCSMARTPGLSASDRLVAVTTLSFDIAVLELLLPLAVGAEVVLASREQASDGHALRALLESCGATVMQATPSTWRLLIEAGWQGAAGFKALVGGEALPPDLAQQLSSRSGELWNMYGPTETTVWSTCARVTEPERGIVIGTPIANTTVWILDERGQPCPIGIPGEIHIGGDGVTLGYLSRPELTAERFIADPFSPTPGARLYRTGDRGRWRHDGQLEHLGRLDFQVKVRGYRIELGEIEAILASHPAIARCVVTTREDRAGDVRLVAYAVPCEGQRLPEAGALREHLRQRLPDYMLPQHFVSLPTLPLLPNGKINRKELPTSTQDAPSETPPAFVDPRTETEQQLAAIWSELLGVDRISVTDNFFDLGGHSLLAMRAVAAAERRLGVRVNPRRYIFESLAQIALARDDDAVAQPRPGLLSRVLNAFREGGA